MRPRKSTSCSSGTSNVNGRMSSAEADLVEPVASIGTPYGCSRALQGQGHRAEVDPIDLVQNRSRAAVSLGAGKTTRPPVIPPTPLETDRTLLRLPEPGDAASFAAALADPEVMRYIGAGETGTLDDAHALVQRMRRAWELDGFGKFTVVRRED